MANRNAYRGAPECSFHPRRLARSVVKAQNGGHLPEKWQRVLRAFLQFGNKKAKRR